MFDITENSKLINVSPPIDAATGSIGLATEWISMKNAEKATFMLSIGANSGSSMSVSLSVANDASGTKSATIAHASTTLSLEYLYKQSGDTYTKVSTTSNALVCSASSYDNCIMVAEVPAAAMGTFVASSTTYNAEYIRMTATDPVGSCLVSCSCLLTGLRYQQDAPPTAIT